MIKTLILIAFAAFAVAQEKPAPPKEPATIKMSDSAAAKIAVAEKKALEAQVNFQNIVNYFNEQIRSNQAYQSADKAAKDAKAALDKIVEAERKAAKADGHEPDVEAQVWKKKVEAAKK